jgi:hypothetical protein
MVPWMRTPYKSPEAGAEPLDCEPLLGTAECRAFVIFAILLPVVLTGLIVRAAELAGLMPAPRGDDGQRSRLVELLKDGKPPLLQSTDSGVTLPVCFERCNR